jgi:hypothetical protein
MPNLLLMSSERQFPRYAVDAEVTIRNRGGGVIARGRTTNLSRGGLCAELDAAPTRGQHVEASIALVFSNDTLSEPLPLPVRIVWCTSLGKTHQTGLSFLSLTPEQTGFLDMFIRFLEDGRVRDEADADPSRSLPFDLSR